ncbi:MAG: GntR family transcriptional regulator [Eggerthellaceae bacterium]
MSLFEIDESSGLPVWVQLRNRFVYLIKTGHYKPGDQLPSVRTLAAEAAINYNTVSKVYVNLEHDGYVSRSAAGASSCAISASWPPTMCSPWWIPRSRRASGTACRWA